MSRRAISFCVCFWLVTPAVWAKPEHKQSLKKYYGGHLSNSLNACTTCHLPPAADADPDAMPPHNPFGVRLRELGKQLQADGKPADLITRLRLVADEDADGDGVANELEILTGHSPGDPNDKPTAEELARGAEVRREFQRERAGYAWEPFQTVARPGVPSVSNRAWVRNPIDAFIAAEHEPRKLTPRPEAPKHVLLRRVYLDLIGLPPTPEELRAFLADESPDAYERVVDHLLSSPQYGERWGRHWMDIWRYSDWAGWTGGNQIRDSQPHIWRWRDWIIESLNADKGYDRLILEMLAADELAPTDSDALRATGYLVRNYKMLSRETWMQDTVNHTAQAFLGITLGCARCHDHMYDPISQSEYYQFRAFFEPHNVRLDRLPGEPDTKKDGLARVFDAEPSVQTFLFVRGDDRNPDKDHPLPPAVPAALGGPRLQIEPVNLPLSAFAPEKLDYVVQETIAASAESIKRADSEQAVEVAEAKHAALLATLRVERIEDCGDRERDPATWSAAATAATRSQRWAALLEARHSHSIAQQALASLRVSADAAAKSAAEKPADQTLKAAAQKAATALTDAQNKLAEAEKQLPKAKQDALLPATTEYTKRNLKIYPATSTGRRLAVARWIAHSQNPLTARVAVNHIWLRHFGAALVPSVFDFGKNGRRPSHPALLDWLAAELMEPTIASPLPPGEGQGEGAVVSRARPWSMKHLHRLIVTSNTYRMASTPDAANLAIDPDNRFLWRMNSRRIEAELVRDNVLYVAGQLDLTMAGPEIDHELGLTSKRRSLYFRHAAEKQMEFLKLFDAAGVSECYERRDSVVPQQALALANSELALTQSRLLARSLIARVGSDSAAFAGAAFERVLARPATPAELETSRQFLAEQERLFQENAIKTSTTATDPADGTKPAADPSVRARENLVHALMNHNDFITVR